MQAKKGWRNKIPAHLARATGLASGLTSGYFFIDEFGKEKSAYYQEPEGFKKVIVKLGGGKDTEGQFKQNIKETILTKKGIEGIEKQRKCREKASVS